MRDAMLTARAFVALAIALVSGCTGRIGEAPRRDGVAPDGPAACGATSSGAGPLTLRRLTTPEYVATVRDLLGATDVAATGVGDGERVGPFLSNATAPVAEVAVDEYARLAEQLAADAASRLAVLVPCDPAREGETECARELVTSLGGKAYRRPLRADEVDRYLALFATGREGRDFASGARLVIAAMLQSPHFLYHVEQPERPSGAVAGRARLDAFSLASRLSYFLWRTMPDDTLRSAAASGELADTAGIERHARRMLESERARAVVADFHDQWLGLHRLDETSPATPALRDEMRRATAAFVVHVVWSGTGSLRELWTAPYAMVGRELAPIYGVDPPSAPDALVKMELDPSQRAGLLTLPSMLATQHHVVRRGKLVRESFFCQTMPPPPPGFSPTPPEPDSDLSPRERWEQHRTNPECAGCHSMMDPIGFGLMHYDELGRWVTELEGFPVDAGGELVATDVDGQFDGAVELAQKLAASDEVAACAVRQWTRYALGREPTDAEACSLEDALERFRASGLDIRELLVAIATSYAFIHVAVTY